MKENKIEATSGLPSQSPTKPIKALSTPSRFLYSEVDPIAEASRNSDMSGGSVICSDCNIEVPMGSKPKATHINSKGMKLMSMPKGKKSVIQFRPRVTMLKSSLEWKIIKTMESETTNQKSRRASFSFNGASVEIKEFKAGGSFELVSACLNPIPNQLSVDSEKIAAVEDIVMNEDSGYGFKADNNTNNIFTLQEAVRPPLVEISTKKHEKGYNQTLSMDIEIRNISKANLKRIDLKIRSKKADKDGEALQPDKRDAVDPGKSSNDQGVELTQLERDMQVDKGGDVSNHLL